MRRRSSMMLVSHRTVKLNMKEINRIMNEADLIHPYMKIDEAMTRMASEINNKLANSNPVVIVLLKGGLVLSGQLLPRLDFPLQLDYVHATRYRDKTEGGSLHWIAQLSMSIKDRMVLLLDDIFDEGHTLVAIRDYCLAAGAKQVQTAVLLDKQHDRKADLTVDYIGLTVPDRYVFGFGMDYKGYLRNANDIYAVKGQ